MFSVNNGSGVDCNVQHDPADIFLTLSIVFGTILSYLPQHLRIMKLKNSEGISPWYLLLGGLASFSNMTNVIILQAPYISCCPKLSTGKCLANLLGSIQMFFQWLMFHLIFLLYYKMYPESSKYTSIPSNSDDGIIIISANWSLSLMIKRVIRVYSFCLMLLVMLLAGSTGFPSSISTSIAWILGIFSMLLSAFQFLPQIHQTFRSQEIGALSITTMLMQTPGSFIFCYTLALSPGINASTWLTYLVTGCLQGILLIICLYLHFTKRSSQYTIIPLEVEGEDL